MGCEITEAYVLKELDSDKFKTCLVIDDAYICYVHPDGETEIPHSSIAWWISEVAQNIAHENVNVDELLMGYEIPTKYEDAIKWANSLPNVAGTGTS